MNLLGIAGIGALATFIATSWRSIKPQIDKVYRLLVVDTFIETYASSGDIYLFIHKHYKYSKLERKTYRSAIPGDSSMPNFIEYTIFNKSLLWCIKKKEFFWFTLLPNGNIKISYMRKCFNKIRFLELLRHEFTYSRKLSVFEIRTAPSSVIFVQSSKSSNDGNDRPNYNNSGLGSNNNSSSGESSDIAASAEDIYYSMSGKDKEYMFEYNDESYIRPYKSSYIVPTKLQPCVDEFINWSTPDIKYVIGDVLNESYYKGYLLHGPPGTGKSSFIKHLAEINGGKSIYMIQLNNISCADLINHFKFVKDENVITVIEDIDTVFNGRERVDKSVNRTDLDFSTLLNCLSGADSPRTGYVFVTTNHLDSIDLALMRDGRLGTVIEITYPDENTLNRMFDSISITLLDFFEELRIKKSRVLKDSYVSRLNVEPLNSDTLDLMVEEIEENRESILTEAKEGNYTTAKFQNIVKSKIIEIYLKYRKKEIE